MRISRFVTMKNISLVFLIFVIYPLDIFCQPMKVLSQFEVFQSGKEINLIWTMNAGNTCLGIDIERSIGGEPFVRIGIINGICGSPTDNASYAFTDNQPSSNTFMSYRLNMGTLGISEEVEIRFIDASKQSVLITPNPSNGYIILDFPHDIPKDCILEVYHTDGRLLDAYGLSEGKKIVVQHMGEEHGLLILAVKNKSGQILASGKLVYQK